MWNSITLPALLVTISAAAATAQDFEGVDILSSPKKIVRFDPTDPAGADVGNPIVTFDESFLRGIEFTGPNRGYYISTSSFGGRGRGIYRFRNGGTRRIGSIPFDAVRTGGLALSRDGSFMYAALDPESYYRWRLFRIDFDGAMSEIGPILLPNGSQNPYVNAIAMNSLTGELFGLDEWHQALIRIDPQTGASELVGSGLGITVRLVGGMDFTHDNSALYIATNSGRIYEVDTQTGRAGPLIGRLPFSAGSIASIPPRRFALGDLNCDREINAFDIEPFLVALFDPVNYASLYPNCDINLADVNGDGELDAFDIEPFLQLLFP